MVDPNTDLSAMPMVNMHETNCVVLCCDDNYLPFARTLVQDIRTFSPRLPIYVLVPQGSERSRLAPFEEFVNFIEVDLEIHEGYLNRSSHISISTYLRLFISDVLPEHIDSFLYLDIDLLILASVDEVFEQKTDFGFSMVPAVGTLTHHPLISEIEDVFYGGVMLVNTQVWKSQNITQKCLEIAREFGPFANQDNDLLLIISKKYGYGKLSVSFNVMNYQKHSGEISIVHFPGSEKPWNSFRGGIYAKEWRRRYRRIEPDFRLGPTVFFNDYFTHWKNTIYKYLIVLFR